MEQKIYYRIMQAAETLAGGTTIQGIESYLKTLWPIEWELIEAYRTTSAPDIEALTEWLRTYDTGWRLAEEINAVRGIQETNLQEVLELSTSTTRQAYQAFKRGWNKGENLSMSQSQKRRKRGSRPLP